MIAKTALVDFSPSVLNIIEPLICPPMLDSDDRHSDDVYDRKRDATPTR